MKTKLTLFTLILITLISCKSTSPEKPYEKDGISFIAPAGWKITGEEDIEGGAFLHLEKDGFNDSGLVSVSWVYGDLGAKRFMEIQKEELQQNAMLQKLTFSPIPNAKFNGKEAIGVSYTFEVLQLPHTGYIYTFDASDRTICVLKQEADEDHDKNKDGFAKFENTFSFD